ncbi:MAG TPA: delta-60 repeat domain-containing protein, partial [Pirellulales bacterium]|nr:delta-60 repeat domain-containing protein [Pirellulales bacterium]
MFSSRQWPRFGKRKAPKRRSGKLAPRGPAAQRLSFESLDRRIMLTAGSLDPTFGSGGIVEASGLAINAIAVQSDGKVIVAGSASDDGRGDMEFTIGRYNVDGTVDSSFGNGGLEQIQMEGFGDQDHDSAINAIAIQPDGKIVVTGSAYNWDTGTSQFATARLNTDGSLDTTFGSGGRTEQSLAEENVLDAEAIQPDGKILVGGGSYPTGAVLIRYNADGTPDDSFGNDGTVTLQVSSQSYSDIISSIALQSDGKIVVVARNRSLQSGIEVARFDADGTLDQTFGNQGTVVILPGENSYASSVAIQSNGDILVGGEA